MRVEQIGRSLASARVKRKLASLPQDIDYSSLSSEDGYRLLHKVHQVLVCEEGWSVAGWKIGATGSKAQQQLGITHPIFGPIYKHTVRTYKSEIETTSYSISRDLVIRVETEYAFLIKRDIVPRKLAYSTEELLERHCERTLLPCVEVGGSRVPSDLRSSLPLLIADTGNCGVVFPAPPYRPTPPYGSPSSITKDGEMVAKTDMYGERPENALKWFVDTAVTGRTPLDPVSLRIGQVVLTGATCGLVPVVSPCTIRARFPNAKGRSGFEINFIE